MNPIYTTVRGTHYKFVHVMTVNGPRTVKVYVRKGG